MEPIIKLNLPGGYKRGGTVPVEPNQPNWSG